MKLTVVRWINRAIPIGHISFSKRCALIWIGTVTGIAIGVLCSFVSYLNSPSNNGHVEKLFVIGLGESAASVGKRLADHGLLRHPWLFSIAARFKGVDHRIRAGQYLLDSSMTPLELLRMVAQGMTSVQGITIPEGTTVDQIARRLEADNITEKGAFLCMAKDQELLRTMRIAADSVEGYLFPDTYYLYQGMGADEVIRTMLRRFNEKITASMRKKVVEKGLTLHEVVTLASIVEKETGREDERPLIASTFMNRLVRGIPLQSDPTVIYSINNFSGNLTKQDLLRPVPYNTYVFKGLPEGPICNPGLASIEAVISAPQTLFLYFVSRNDGTHQFSTDLEHHNHAVARYQKKKEPAHIKRRSGK